MSFRTLRGRSVFRLKPTTTAPTRGFSDFDDDAEDDVERRRTCLRATRLRPMATQMIRAGSPGQTPVIAISARSRASLGFTLARARENWRSRERWRLRLIRIAVAYV